MRTVAHTSAGAVVIAVPGQLALDFDAATERERTPDPLPGYIPSRRIVPIIEAWLAKDETRNLALLSARSRVSPDALRRLARGESSTVRFRTADRLICAMGDPTIWHRPPPDGLGDLYGSPLVAAPGSAPARAVVSTSNENRPRDAQTSGASIKEGGTYLDRTTR